jgi:hypothetical protein
MPLLCGSQFKEFKSSKAVANDVAWFIANRGLTRGRIDVLNLIETKVPTSQIEEVFGPKVSKNDYRCDRKVPPNIVKGIL